MRRRVPFLLVLLALVCVSLMPVSVSAQPRDSVSRQLSALESRINRILAREGVSGPEDAYKLEDLSSQESAVLMDLMLRYAELRAAEDEERSYRALADQTADVETMQLTSSALATSGTIAVNGNTSGHLTCWNGQSNRHDHASGKSWFPVGVWKADSYGGTSEACVVIGPAGWGSAWSWAYAGQTLAVTGSGSSYATITMTGAYWGLLSCFASGSASWTIDLIVKDLTSGATFTSNVAHDSSAAFCWREVDTGFSQAMVVNLTASHTYMVHLKVKCSASIKSGGEAGADFGYGDGDGGCAWYEHFHVDW